MIRFYNTLTRRMDTFSPMDPRHIRMYVCGPTVYDAPHIGNARPVVVFDVLFRLLRHHYPFVTYVRNITDIDDKINHAARANGERIDDLTERTIAMYARDVARLNTLPPTHTPRATHYIPAMIDFIGVLMKKDIAYAQDGHVLFRVHQSQGYGNFSKKPRDELLAGARIDVAPYKENPEDFVLWKPSSEDEPGWDSPFGRGRPGWHIECSAMAAELLGEAFDIHGGGIDLVFPHHENEIAQSKACHGNDVLAHYWLHNGHVTVNGEKMAKSVGNVILLHEALADHPGEVVRLTLLMTHYRQPMDWTDDTLGQARHIMDRLFGALRDFDPGHIDPSSPAAPDPSVIDALNDDLNTPLAYRLMLDLAAKIFKTSNRQEKRHLQQTLWASGQLMGFFAQTAKAWFETLDDGGPTRDDIDALLQERTAAKAARNFQRADEIRDYLANHNIMIDDTPQGPRWRRT